MRSRLERRVRFACTSLSPQSASRTGGTLHTADVPDQRIGGTSRNGPLAAAAGHDRVWGEASRASGEPPC